MNTGGHVEAVQEPGDPPEGMGTPVADEDGSALKARMRSPREICTEYGSDFVPPAPLDKAAVALATLDQWPLNARRITPERGSCGWYLWGGEGSSSEPGFFQPLHVAHLLERFPHVMPFLALAPGWRVRLAQDGTMEIKPPHDVAPPANVSHAVFDSPAPRTPSVTQWAWLSILLHVLAILLFGDTTGGGSQRGDRLGGALNVTLQGKVERGADARPALPALRADTRLSSLDTRAAAVVPPPAKDAPTADAASPPPPAPAEETPAAQVMPPVIATEVEKPVTTFVVPLTIPELTTPPQPPVAKLPETIPRLDAFTPPKVAAPAKVERDIALPTELIPRLAAPVPAQIERAASVPIEAAPRLKPLVTPKIEVETPQPPVEIPRLSPLPTPALEREFVRPAELLPRLAPVAPAPTIEAATPQAEVAPRFVAPPVAPAPPAPVTAAAKERATDAASTPTPPATTATPAPAASRIPAGPSGTPGSTGTADAGAPRGSVAIPTSPAGSALRLDADAVRQRAREIARDGSGQRALLPFNVKPKEEFKTKEQQAFDKALKRPDCRDAYAGMGLAAVVPLVWDSVSEKGCKW